MSYPRRSARLSPSHVNHQQPHQPLPQQQHQAFSNPLPPTFAQFSQPSSTSSTSHPSPSNDSSNPPPPPPTPAQARLLQVQTAYIPQHHNAQQETYAPLPSPSAGDMEPLFPRTQPQPNSYSYPQQGQQGQQGQQQGLHQVSSHPHQGHQQHPHHNSMSQQQPPSIQGGSGGHPGQLPPDFLAEAAKRAQMACLMRDLGDVSL